jgi:hypothetical protein
MLGDAAHTFLRLLSSWDRGASLPCLTCTQPPASQLPHQQYLPEPEGTATRFAGCGEMTRADIPFEPAVPLSPPFGVRGLEALILIVGTGCALRSLSKCRPVVRNAFLAAVRRFDFCVPRHGAMHLVPPLPWRADRHGDARHYMTAIRCPPAPGEFQRR